MWLLLLACKKDSGDGIHRAMLLVLDGVRVEELTSTWASGATGVSGETLADQLWSEVVPEGVVVRRILNPSITLTAPAHASLLTGRTESYANFAEPHAGESIYRPVWPTLFEAVNECFPGQSLYIANTELLMDTRTSLYPGMDGLGADYQLITDEQGIPADEDEPVFAAIQEAWSDTPPRLLVANLHDADRAGHYGQDNDYKEGVEIQDEELATLWSWLAEEKSGFLEDTLVVITADHGRHRHDEDQGWHNHGDACAGCREVPLLLLGGPTRSGEVAELYLHEDLAPTIASWLGVKLPYSTGLAMSEAVDVQPEIRGGLVEVAEAGGSLGGKRYLEELLHRAAVEIDGQSLSDPEALDAGGLAIVGEAGSLVACFRELFVDESIDSSDPEVSWPWSAHCLQQEGAGWQDIEAPALLVNPSWKPDLKLDSGRIWAAWAQNPNGIANRGTELNTDIGVAVAIYEEDWRSFIMIPADFPTDPVLAIGPEEVLVAYGSNPAGTDARYRRRIQLELMDPTGRRLKTHTFELEDILTGPHRSEQPALSLEEGMARLGFVAASEDQRAVVLIESSDSGKSWGEPLLIASKPFFGIQPVWVGSRLVWAAQEENGDAALCFASLEQPEPACISTGAGRIDSFVVREDGSAEAVVDSGVAAWTSIQLSLFP